ncbi:MAG: sodium/solute symporter [Patescibacteria group bacterium]|nr:sodium/solute symporter [Patescibacteria group bacterium]
MGFGVLDAVVFVGFVACVIALGLVKSSSKEEKNAEDYFLAGRGLTWWLVGFSLIAANISTEQFVGMSGKAADWLGMAIASYEWMAAITLVITAFVFLPTFLRSGIYTIPEFLEYRYNPFARTVMAVSTLIILVGVPTAAVVYSGAKVISVFFQDVSLLGLDLGNITVDCWIIGCLAAGYVFAGGLKACAWADLLQGSALIIGGGIIAWLAMNAMSEADPVALAQTAANSEVSVEKLAAGGAVERFIELNRGPLPEGKLHMVRPADDPEIPWPALLLGLWIPNFFYWGLNQYITQRTLGSRSLSEGQRGVVFAALLKLVIPFVVVIPGIMAFNLYSGDLKNEAARKNEKDAFPAFQAGAEVVFPFNEQFAQVNREMAGQVLQHNAALANQPVGEAAGPAEMTAANAKLIDAAKQRGVPVHAVAMIGYDYDAAFPTLLKNLLPGGNGLMGFVLAAIFGAVVSSLASMLNSASTIFAMDIYGKFRARSGGAGRHELVTVGRVCVVVFVLIAMFIAPALGSPKFGGIFTFIQEFQGFISPGILAIFIFGVLVPKAPRAVGTVGLLLNPILYGTLKIAAPQIAFLNRMAICFVVVLAVLAIMTVLKPLKTPIVLPVNEKMDMRTDRGTRVFGFVVVAMAVALYVIFW